MNSNTKLREVAGVTAKIIIHRGVSYEKEIKKAAVRQLSELKKLSL